MLQIFVIKNVKDTEPWTYFINDLNDEETIGSFYEKELQKTNQKKFRVEKIIKRKGDGKDMTFDLIVGLIKKTLYKNGTILS